MPADRPLALVLVCLLAAPALAAGPEKVWMITGTGKVGDCMSEWMLRWDPAFDPDLPGFDPGDPDDPTDTRHPQYAKGGSRGRLRTVQKCTDNAPCDQDTIPGQCTFHVGLCFCVADPDALSCASSRAMWCAARHPPAEDLAPLFYGFSKPAVNTTDATQRLALCRLTRAIAGGDEPCDPVEPDFVVEGPTPLLTPGDAVEAMPQDPASPDPNRNTKKQVFRFVPDPLNTEFRSALHRITEANGVTEGGIPYRPYSGQGAHQQFVRRFSEETCSDLVPIVVPRGNGTRSITLRARWEPDQNFGEIDRGGGDKLKLICAAP